MATSVNKQNNAIKKTQTATKPTCYSPETGIYKSIYPSMKLPTQTFLDIVSFILSQEHNGVNALIDSSSGFSVSYSQLYSFVKSIASGLHQMNVKQGDVILILLPNSVFFPIIFLACLSLGAIVTPMNPFSSLSEIKKQVIDSNACFAFSVSSKVDALFHALGGIQVIEVSDNYEVVFTSNDRSVLRKLISSDPDIAPRPKITQHDVAAIMYSSGTTGKAKGVMLTHGNFIAMVELFVRFDASLYDFQGIDFVNLAVVPMYHVYGLSLYVMGLLSLGGVIVVMKRFDGNEMVNVIEKYGVTHLHVVPPLLMAVTRKGKNEGVNKFKSLKQVTCGAAPLATKSIEEFIETFPDVDFIQGYGLTESAAVGTRGYNSIQGHKHASVGFLAPNSEAKVVDIVTGSCLPPGSVGELWLRSPGIMRGYLNNTEATMAAVDENGWLHTGDIVYFDQEGSLYVLDRLKEVIKYKGFQVAPADLESVLVSHPDVLDAAVTAANDEEAGEIPVAYVVPRDGSSVTPTILMNFVANQVAPYKKVRRVFFRSSIPRSATGKILRRELRSLAATSKL